MPKTQVRGTQIRTGKVQRVDLNTTTPAKAVVTKIIAGTGVSITWTGADQGTGDVVLNG